MGAGRRRGVVAVLGLALSLSLALQAGASASIDRAVSPHVLSPGDHIVTLTVGGFVRSLILHVPPGVAVANRPLLLIYHGHGDTAQSTEKSTDFASVADRTGEVVAFLQGYQNSWNEDAGTTPAALAKVDDVAFTSAAIAKIEGMITFDHKRIVAVGFSNGALMVETLGCKLAKTLAMVIPVEGQLAVSVAATCAPKRPIGVYEIHGTSDSAIYYSGGPINGHGTVVLSAPKNVAKWAQLDHCAKTPSTSYLSSSILITKYKSCRYRVKVVLRTIIGGVHQWGSDIGEVVAGALPS